jgi:hypothetical protein
MDDIHYVHFNCRGKEFKTVHELAKEYYDQLADDFDNITELCMEYGMSVPNPIHAAELLNYVPLSSDHGFSYSEGIGIMRSLISSLLVFINGLHESVDDVNLKIYLEDLIQYWSKQCNYILARMEADVTAMPGDTGDSLLDRMPEAIFDNFRKLFDSNGLGSSRAYLESIYSKPETEAILISFSRKNNFAKDEGGDNGGGEGGGNGDIDAQLQEKVNKLDEKVFNEILEVLKNPTEDAVNGLSKEASEFLQGLSKEELNRLQELVTGEGGDGGQGGEDTNTPIEDQILQTVQGLSPDELEELRLMLFDPNGKDGSGKDPEITKSMKDLIDSFPPEQLDLLKDAVSQIKAPDMRGGDQPPEDPEDPNGNAQPGPEGQAEQDLLDMYDTLDDDTRNELRSIIKIGKGTGTNIKIERELMDALSKMSDERINMLAQVVDEAGDGLPHENREEYQVPVQDPNKAPTNLEPDYQKSQMIVQDPANYRLDSMPGGRVSDPAGAQFAMNQANQNKIQGFSRRGLKYVWPRYNFNNIATVYAQIEDTIGEELPKDIMDTMIQAYEQAGKPGIAAVLADRNLTPEHLEQLAFIISQKDPQENFRSAFSRRMRYPW